MFMRRRQYTTSRRTQSGVAALMAAVLLFSMVAFMALVTDTGRLYFEKRSQQKDTDLAALETALRYCRNQTMDDAALDLAAENVMARNNYKGSFEDGGDSTINATLVGENGVEVVVTRQITPSLFERMMNLDNDPIILTTTARANACEPTAQLTIRSQILSVDTEKSDLLNALLGGLLGTTLSLDVGGWQSLLDTNLNLLSYLDEAALSLGIEAGDYDTLLATDISVYDLLDLSADVLQAGGDTVAVNAIRDIALAVPGMTPLVQLGELIKVQTGSEEAGLDADLQVMQLVQGAIQLANNKSGVEAELDIDLGVATAYLRVRVTEPPAFSAIGNPQMASEAPYGNNAIFARNAQLRAFASVELPLASGLNALLDNPVLTGITDLVNDVLSLDIIDILTGLTCIVYCERYEEVTDIDILSSPRVDLVVTAGEGEARVTDYNCDDATDSKTLDVLAKSSVATVTLGNMGADKYIAADNAMGSAPYDVDPVPILDIGTISVKYWCTLALICSTEYLSGGSWVSDRSLADRNPYVGGGVALRIGSEDPVQDDLQTAVEGTLTYENSPSEDYLPKVNTGFGEEAYQSIESAGLVTDINSLLTDIDLVYYTPDSGNIGNNGLGTLLALVGSVVNTLVDGLTDAIALVLGPLLDSLLNEILGLLGATLAETEVGAALTCENDTVRLSR
ncbi:hypothetical protein I6N98_05455 [Spongiibacter nanhainus]|uniref:Putative Flp pilus-assembly TadG-like N-terminal domain-containing protein n=1 Tax=Spongiibacter nanhainus TaxID=2794344 RepID=A0A7T4R2M8_9GAMM|nr:pilus assembly protein TadG-related protein [Spongiibacter nanhainus]QQD19300.1 hypothetical protein I6N98_05455 [Spongiibacter nanhainus]